MSRAARRLVYCWDPTLREPCAPADPADPDLPDLIRDMRRIMEREQGVGLAAPQVGDRRRVILIRRPEDPPARARVLVNPELTELSPDRVPFLEGCLSFPGVYRNVMRPRAVRVRYRGEDGQEQELADDALLARVVQHEIDHLDGILFVDHLSGWERLRVRLRMGLWRLGWR